MNTETLTWFTPAEQMPDDEQTVLLDMPGADERIWPGYRDGDEWRLADGMPAPRVCRWAEMPRGKA